ncbi:hypothetical protein AUC68_11255 [Methyloceanibacter methanicus]|uniref:Tyr recombinase domain-containing protein n=1 Tax=Methyloceanibacter methanicus TaxID=1774968 RepID=A0A1E3VX24_9HYPH|nr:hypothetical protein AUC68_11255 [Methyloceanibacter methanicus]
MTSTGSKSFVVVARWPSTRKTARRKLGDAKRLGLSEARKKAKAWLALVEDGKDPVEVERARREAEARDRAVTFESVANNYIREHLAGKRRGSRTAAEIRRDVVPVWRDRPISSIRHGDVVALVRAIRDSGRSRTAHNALTNIKSIFSWAVNEGVGRFGVDQSPAVLVKPKLAIGEKRARDRVLNDDELFALWRAAKRIGYPDGDAVRLLMLTGARLSEVGEARWRETNRHDATLVVSPDRYKTGQTHTIPLTETALAILDGAPRFDGDRDADFIFTTTNGAKAVNRWGPIKKKIDARIIVTLRALARRRGYDPNDTDLPHFVFHDIRRTFRTRLAVARVPLEVAELCIGHARTGIEAIYDRHAYASEIREAFERWERVLMEIVGETGPAPKRGGNVVSFATRRGTAA